MAPKPKSFRGMMLGLKPSDCDMVLVAGKLCSQWARIWGQWTHNKDGTTLWEDGALDKKIVLDGDSMFGGPGWSRSIETAY